MKAQELLNENPFAKAVIKEWFLEQMLENIQDDKVPEDFKKLVRMKGVEDEHICSLIDVNPRSLFDVLDRNDVIVIINYHENSGWIWLVNGVLSENKGSRREAELEGIFKGVIVLNKRLEDEKNN